MRDLNDDSNNCSWPLYYGDKTFINRQHYNGFLPKTSVDAYPGHDRDFVRRTMLKHEAVFTDQVHELHRLYKIQRGLMDEMKRKELLCNQVPLDTSLSSSPLASQTTSEDARKWHMSGFSVLNSVSTRLTNSRVEEIHSPFYSKGSSLQASPLPCQNGVISRDVEIVESRPMKVRRRMLDLQLPAEEYICTERGEKHMGEKISSFSSYFPCGSHKIASGNGSNIVLGNGRRNCGGDPSKSESCLRSRFNLADLNEPIEVQETDASGFVDLVGHHPLHPEVRGRETADKLNSQPIGFPDKAPMNSLHSCYNGSLNNSQIRNSANSGLSKNNIASSVHHAAKLPMSSQSGQTLFNKIHDPSSVRQSDSNVDFLRQRTIGGLQPSEKCHVMANDNQLQSLVASHAPSSYQVASSNLANSRPPSVSSWEKPSCCSIQKSVSAQMQPYLNASTNMSRSSEPSTWSQSLFDNRWNYNGTSNCDSHFGNEIPTRKGYYKGSSSGSKGPLIYPPAGNNHPNGSSSNHVATEQFVNNGSVKLYKGLNHDNSGSTKDVNLNAVYSSIKSSKLDHQANCEFIDLERSNEDHLASLPWPRSKLSPKDEATATGFDLNTEDSSFEEPPLNQLSARNETGRGIDFRTSQHLASVSCSKNDPIRFDVNDSSSCRKILGFPICESQHIQRNDSSSNTSRSVPLPQASADEENIQKNIVIDINIPCDPALSDVGEQTTADVSVVMETEFKVAKREIDLNSCMSEEEASLVPPVAGSKLNTGIDLEAPLLPESDEDVTPSEECLQDVHEPPSELQEGKAETHEDESVRMAAEAIFAISSSIDQDRSSNVIVDATNGCMTDPLQWFAEIISSSGENLDSCMNAASKGNDREKDKRPLTKVLDYFESMTLELMETKEEDYMPKPLVPETLILEETTTMPLLTRTRRGQARRGRQRRDFQRDILPGLASLSRHEVTEDIQTFGGLMRATGYLWQSGLTRRSSTRSRSTRGRRRVPISASPPAVPSPPCTPLIQHLNNNEVGLEDRNLTGWGKTTRRPRRQRCPAGNPPSIPLT